MRFYRCRCGQPLAAFATGFGAAGFPFSTQFVDRAVDDALETHLQQLGRHGHADLTDHGRDDRVAEPAAEELRSIA